MTNDTIAAATGMVATRIRLVTRSPFWLEDILFKLVYDLREANAKQRQRHYFHLFNNYLTA